MVGKRNPIIEAQVGIEIRGRSIRIIFYYQGIRCRETVATGVSKSNVNYATRRRAEILRKIEDNEFDYELEFPSSKKVTKFNDSYKCSVLFENLIARYMKSNKKPITKKTYCRMINAKLVPYFGEIAVKDVNAQLIRKFIATLKHTRHYINQVLLHLRAMLDYALNDGLINKQPMLELSIDKLIENVETESEYEVLPLTKRDQEKLLDACDDQLIKNFIILAVNTGMRIGELIALRWADIHDDYIEVNFNMVKGDESTPKTDMSMRKIMILPKAAEALSNLRAITGEYENVIVSLYTKKPWLSSDAFWKHWVKLIKKAGIKYRQPYQMRHTYASTLLSQGENPLWVATQMGHVDTEMITKRYGKWIPDNREKSGYKLKGDYSS